MRKSTLRDARKLSLWPSVSEILNIVAKPALTNWIVDNAILSALTYPKKESETDKQWVARVKKDGADIANIAATIGSSIHFAVEQKFLGTDDPVYSELAQTVVSAIYERFGTTKGWEVESSFAYDGYGGCIDLLNRDLNIIIDYKTKEKMIKGKKLAYDNHFLQLTAYADGIGMPDATKYNLFVGYDGTLVWHEWESDCRRERRMFRDMFRLFQDTHKYYTSKEMIEEVE